MLRTRRLTALRSAALVTAAFVATGCMHGSGRHAQRGPSSLSEAVMARHVPATAPAVVPNPFDVDNPAVDGYVAAFTRSPAYFDRALVRGSRYLISMTDILAREGLPTQLAYLPLIESGYRTDAVSRAGATGPWQFVRRTGRLYGLRIDSMVDERRDPIKSTEAAVRLLKTLHSMFGDWELSLAAYNVGEVRVTRLLDRGIDDYWTMRRYLPRETSDYVPRFLAALRIAQQPNEYGIESPIHRDLQFETVQVDRDLRLDTASALSGVPEAELAALNPALRRDITPRGYEIRVPVGSATVLREALERHSEHAAVTGHCRTARC